MPVRKTLVNSRLPAGSVQSLARSNAHDARPSNPVVLPWLLARRAPAGQLRMNRWAQNSVALPTRPPCDGQHGEQDEVIGQLKALAQRQLPVEEQGGQLRKHCQRS